MKNAFRQMYVTVCGRLNHLTDDVPNEGGVGGKGIKGNALRRLNAVQISRKVVIQMAGMIFQTRSRTSHYAAKSVRKHSGLDASSHGTWL